MIKSFNKAPQILDWKYLCICILSATVCNLFAIHNTSLAKWSPTNQQRRYQCNCVPHRNLVHTSHKESKKRTALLVIFFVAFITPRSACGLGYVCDCWRGEGTCWQSETWPRDRREYVPLPERDLLFPEHRHHLVRCHSQFVRVQI